MFMTSAGREICRIAEHVPVASYARNNAQPKRTDLELRFHIFEREGDHDFHRARDPAGGHWVLVWRHTVCELRAAWVTIILFW